ncbi:MAG: PspA/IM30 family protein [Hydrococcus sp. SU_1_0]|nr:PspA/IM30 family protein [Hydrococcus sp. SU_1_0]
MSIIDILKTRITIFFKSFVNKPEDPIKVLEVNIIDMQENILVLRQAVSRQIATTQRIEQQYNKNQQEANACQQRADLAQQRGDEDLVRKALRRKKFFLDSANSMKNLLLESEPVLDEFKSRLTFFESKVAEVNFKKKSFIRRINCVRQAEKIEKIYPK